MFSDKGSNPSNKLINYPKLNFKDLTEQTKFDLQWYVIGKKNDFLANRPKKIQIWNTNYVVWRNENNTIIALDDVCPHKGASLSAGKICDNNIVCPYHGYEFNNGGTLTKVPGICFKPSPIYDIKKFNTIEKNGWVYLNTDTETSNDIDIDKSGNSIYTEPEIEQGCSVVHLDMEYNCYSRILSENSLDIMHIAFVHTFGNKKRPNPLKEIPPRLIGPNHYQSTYYYSAGEDSIAKKVFGVNDLIIENEFILPHTTVARVKFSDQVSTVITFALPIGDNKSKLFVKTYRNFWDNQLGQAITKNTMYNTMLQDKFVVESIDRRFMDGKFNMKFDKLQNTYKSFYKRFVHQFDEIPNIEEDVKEEKTVDETKN
jgi:phenylpropionate dioxygenase-like ring-hydroxylating dioxygenase large terminal subunit